MNSKRLRITLFLGIICLGAFAFWLVAGRGGSPVNVNTASFETLDDVPWLTPSVARKIIDDRPFNSVDELLRVSGIGEKTLEKIRRHVTVD